MKRNHLIGFAEALGLLFLVFGMTTAHGWEVGENSVWKKFYVGVDVGIRQNNYVEDQGAGFFKKRSNQYNGYVGFKITENIALEAGYETTERRSRVVNVARNVSVLGEQGLEPGVYSSSVRIFGPHVGVRLCVPLWPERGLDLFTKVGVSFLKVKAKQLDYVMQRGMALGNLFSPGSEFETKFSKTRPVLITEAGLLYRVNRCVSLKGFLGFENTGRFSNIKATERARMLSLRNSFVLGAGVQFSI